MQLNLTNNNFTITSKFDNEYSEKQPLVRAVIVFYSFFFSIGHSNLHYENTLITGFYNSSTKNNYNSSAANSHNYNFNISEGSETIVIEEEVDAMSNNDKEFGALQEQSKNQEKIIEDIRDSLKTIKSQTDKIQSKDDIKELIEASINKARLNTIRWIVGTGIGLATLIIGAIKLFF